MANTYKAMEVTSPGVFTLVERPIPEPGPGQVRIRVEACGVCHSDSVTVENILPGITYPRVPGHEIAGRIEAVGEGVAKWRAGERAGLGWFGGECGHCQPCRRGDLVNCVNLIVSGLTTDGGYAEVVLAEARALASVPRELSAAQIAPLMCAGLTTFNALRNAKLRAGDLVAIQGIGGLGHLAVQFARKMGFKTVAIQRGREKEQLARQLGANEYIDSTEQNAVDTLLKMGGANAVVATASSGKSMGPLIEGLAPRGKLLVVGASAEPIEINSAQLIFGMKTVQGENVGTPVDEEDTLNFSVLQAIRPMIETMPLEKAAEAYARMMAGKADFRMVLTMGS